jgi:hypothetical protein
VAQGFEPGDVPQGFFGRVSAGGAEGGEIGV